MSTTVQPAEHNESAFILFASESQAGDCDVDGEAMTRYGEMHVFRHEKLFTSGMLP
jgi:hypothetical protein